MVNINLDSVERVFYDTICEENTDISIWKSKSFIFDNEQIKYRVSENYKHFIHPQQLDPNRYSREPTFL